MQKGRLPFQNAAIYGHAEGLKLLLKEPGTHVDSLMMVREYRYIIMCYNPIPKLYIMAIYYVTGSIHSSTPGSKPRTLGVCSSSSPEQGQSRCSKPCEYIQTH